MRHKIRSLSVFILILTLCLLCLSGCGKKAPASPFSYAEQGFSLAVEGNIVLYHERDPIPNTPFSGKIRAGEPLHFKAHVSARPLTAGEVHDTPALTLPLWRIEITYTAPAALAGLTVSCLYNRQISDLDTEAIATVSYENPAKKLSLNLPYAAVSHLCFPAVSLLPRGDVTSVSPVAGGIKTVTVTEGASKTVYTFSKDSPYPMQVETVSQSKSGVILIGQEP